MPSLIISIVIMGIVLGTIVGAIATKKYHYLCLTLFFGFSILTGWLYSQSAVPMSKDITGYLGVGNISVMNLQATIFTAASAIISILCLLGFFITKQQYCRSYRILTRKKRFILSSAAGLS